MTYASIHVPYYRNLFKEIGLDINRFRGREDMEKIPLLDKDILRTRTNEFISDQIDSLICKDSKTSGSTGTPLKLKLDEISRINKMAAAARQHTWAGNRLWRRKFLIVGLSESKKDDYGWDFPNNQIFLNSSRMTKDNCVAAAKLVSKLKPCFFEGYARSFIDFYNIVKDLEIVLPKPIGILCYGESVSPEIRNFIEKVYETKFYDFYTLTENAAMICEMPDHNQYLMEDYFYPEIIDSNGKLSQNGYGELVGTSFYNYAMPLIRYKTRDSLQLAKENNPPQKAFRKVELIEGRMDDNLLMPDGRKIYFAEGAISYAKGIIASQYIQEDANHVIINLIIDDEFTPDFYPEIEKGLRKRLGDGQQFEFRIVTELEKKKSGKTPFIINKIDEFRSESMT